MTTVAVMRPRDRLPESALIARDLGLDPVCASPLEPVASHPEVLEPFLRDLRDGRAANVMLTSATGVGIVADMGAAALGRDRFIELMSRARVWAIGPRTARALREAGLRADMVPDDYTSAGLAGLFRGGGSGPTYVLRSAQGDPALMDGLRAAGAEAREIAVYRLAPNEGADLDALRRASLEGGIDVFAFSSALSAESFLERLGRDAGREAALGAVNRSVVAAIGPPTRARLESLGVRVDAMPAKATFRAMLEASIAFRDGACQRRA